MTRQTWSWSSVRRLVRLPAWAAVVAVAFAVGTIVGPMAAGAGLVHVSARSGPPSGVPPLKHVFVIMMENTSYADLLWRPTTSASRT